MHAREVLEIFNRYWNDAPVMVSSGRSGSILWQISPRDYFMNNTGMGYTTPACFGLALGRPDLKVVAIEGDGAMLLGLPNLATVGRYLPRNLAILVMNNQAYVSTNRGELPSASAFRADIAAAARALGIEQAVAVDSVEQLEPCVRRAMAEDGPWLIVANVDRTLVMEARGQKEPGDRTETSISFQRWLREARPAPTDGARRRSAHALDSKAGPSGIGLGAARVIYGAMKQAGVDFTVYLPDSVVYPIQELAELDAEMATICCTREDEGVAIASGAYFGGRFPALVIDGTGVGMSGFPLMGAVLRRTPMLLVTSHSEALGIHAIHDAIPVRLNEPVLRALGITYAVLWRLKDAGVVIQESVKAAQVLKAPVAVVIPPYVMHEADHA